MSDSRTPFPASPVDAGTIMQDLRARKADDLDWERGRSFSYVYYADHKVTELLKEAYSTYFSENALNPAAFPSLRNMEREVVQMCLDLMHAPDTAAGSMTSGGTESILMALKSAKEHTRVNKPSITRPNIVLPHSAHPAFNKGCDYFGIEIKAVPYGVDYRVTPAAIEAAIDDQTILIVASAPQYPQGVVDPIGEIGKVALRHNVLMHVDACVGGFLMPFTKDQIAFDFAVAGVTSMSADIHKYGYASKGCSVILYRDADLRKAQFYVYTDWPGGMYGSPSIAGTRPGGAIAVAHTVMRAIGRSGYERLVAKKMELVDQFMSIISSHKDLHIIGKPDLCLFSFGSDSIDIYRLGDEMYVKGWLMDRQQTPPALHISVSPNHEHYIDEFAADLEECLATVKRASLAGISTKVQVAAAKGLKKLLPAQAFKKVQQMAMSSSDPDDKRSAALYGMIGDLKGDGELDDLIRDYLDHMMR